MREPWLVEPRTEVAELVPVRAPMYSPAIRKRGRVQVSDFYPRNLNMMKPCSIISFYQWYFIVAHEKEVDERHKLSWKLFGAVGI